MALVSTRIDADADRDTWHLENVATAMVALGEILAKDGYRGAPIFDGLSQVVGLEINGPNTHAEARIGDYLVEDIGIRAFTAETYAANYTAREA